MDIETRDKNFQNLVREVSAISKKYDEIAKITGEKFNVFDVLGLSIKEVRTHTAFIAALLNPKGSHGQESVFLELFAEGLKDILEDNTVQKLEAYTGETAKASEIIVEEYIGKIDGESGGRVDLVIKNNKNVIVIENKIYAKDQKKQLVRYHDKYPNSLLLYLTLKEKEASEESITTHNGEKLESGVNYFNITYKNDIKNWLEKCKEKAVSQPILRETIEQYIILIKKLTGQSINRKMDENIKGKIISSKENADSARLIVNNYQKAIEQKLGEFRLELQSSLEKELVNEHVKLSEENRVVKIDDNTKKIRFSLQQCKECNCDGKDLCFEISRVENKKVFYFGFRFPSNDQNSKKYDKCKEFLSEICIQFNQADNYWIKKRIYANDMYTFGAQLCDKNTFKKEIESVTKDIKEAINEYHKLVERNI